MEREVTCKNNRMSSCYLVETWLHEAALLGELEMAAS